MPGFRYGALLPPFSLNLFVREIESSVQFYQHVFQAEVHYYDVDFAALRAGRVEVMLHADHTHEEHAWFPELVNDAKRGIGGQLRVLGMDPESVEHRKRAQRKQCATRGKQTTRLARNLYARSRWLRMGRGRCDSARVRFVSSDAILMRSYCVTF
jgi:hypothetical protein